MTLAPRLPILSLVLFAAFPLAWLACGGGESKPAESPSSDTSASASSDAPAGSDSSSPAASASAAEAPAASATAEAPAPAAAPPPPTLGSSDCGTCIDKSCAKPEAACAKSTDCQSTLDGIHGCSSGAAACLESATAPTAAKPKKLAAAYEACAKKAIKMACKAKCQ